MLVAGLVCLVMGVLALYKLAPRAGRPNIPWMDNEAMGITVALVLMALMAGGVALLYRAAT
jgi:hypothetical protein